MAAMKIYFIEGLLFLLLTLGLFVVAATGEGRDYSEPGYVVFSDTETFMPFFAWMLAWAGLGATLGLMQSYVMLPNRLKLINVFAFGIGLLGYVFGYYWNIRGMVPSDSANPLTWLVFLSGLVLILSLVANAMGVVWFSVRRK